MQVTIKSHYEWDRCGDDYLKGHDREITFSFDESESVEIRIENDSEGDGVYNISKEELKRILNFIPPTISSGIV